jgi:hypothetical protein
VTVLFLGRLGQPSVDLVAMAKMAGSATINEFIEKEWLPKVGAEIKKRVGGTVRVDFKQGFIVMVTTGRDDAVEVIGIRVNTYRNEVSLHYALDGDASDVDALALSDAMKKSPDLMADWAVAGTAGRGQALLPFTPSERAKREDARRRREERERRS